jgi:hypothetical protein
MLAYTIHRVLGRYRGVWITTDAHTTQYREAAIRLDKTIPERQNRVSRSTGSSLESNFFSDENDLRAFFDKAGFLIDECQYSGVIQDLSSIRLLNLNQDDMKRVFELLSMSKALILTLRST